MYLGKVGWMWRDGRLCSKVDSLLCTFLLLSDLDVLGVGMDLRSGSHDWGCFGSFHNMVGRHCNFQYMLERIGLHAIVSMLMLAR